MLNRRELLSAAPLGLAAFTVPGPVVQSGIRWDCCPAWHFVETTTDRDLPARVYLCTACGQRVWAAALDEDELQEARPMNEQTVAYAATDLTESQRKRICDWMASETPSVPAHGTFLTEIIRVDGRPVRVRHHRFATDSDGRFYPDPSGQDVATVPPVELPITSEPFPPCP